MQPFCLIRTRMAMALVAAVAFLLACGSIEREAAPAQAPPGALPPLGTSTAPNIVFVLTDDLSTDLLRFMPNVRAMQQAGTSFTNHIVSASLCCPSRASILTGRLPHNSGVLTNIYPRGGFGEFVRNGNNRRTFAGVLRGQGYRTALMGKYLNGYRADAGGMPPGWTDFAGGAVGYRGYDYTLNVDGFPTGFGHQPQDYMTDVLARLGGEFIGAASLDDRPFLLKLSTFTPHRPAVPAPRHLAHFETLQTPRGPAFNAPNERPVAWLARRPERRPRAIARMDELYRQRARSVLAIDEMVGHIQERLKVTGEAANTYFVFSSDNGYHMGEHRLLPGKLTAFDSDIRVPLIVTGPGVSPGDRVGALTQNTDLAPTFEELAGALPRRGVDGRSLVGLMRGQSLPRDWRRAALIEHRFTHRSANDPDEQTPASGDPPTYRAIRTYWESYVEYADGQREYYDLRRDPAQQRNVYTDLGRKDRKRLHRELQKLATCRGIACATARPGR